MLEKKFFAVVNASAVVQNIIYGFFSVFLLDFADEWHPTT